MAVALERRAAARRACDVVAAAISGPIGAASSDLHAAAGAVEVDALGARRRREQGEDPAREAARAGAREVEVPAVAAGREVGRVLARDARRCGRRRRGSRGVRQPASR